MQEYRSQEGVRGRDWGCEGCDEACSEREGYDVQRVSHVEFPQVSRVLPGKRSMRL